MKAASPAGQTGTRPITRRCCVVCDGRAFAKYVPADLQSHIITSFLFPDDPNFEFKSFYQRLSDKGMVIYPGKLTEVDCFRIGNIGRIFESDIESLLTAIKTTLLEMNVTIPDQDSAVQAETSDTVEYEDYKQQRPEIMTTRESRLACRSFSIIWHPRRPP